MKISQQIKNATRLKQATGVTYVGGTLLGSPQKGYSFVLGPSKGNAAHFQKWLVANGLKDLAAFADDLRKHKCTVEPTVTPAVFKLRFK